MSTWLASKGRFVFAIQLEFEEEALPSQLVWVSSPPKGVSMSNATKSWMDACVGDVVIRHGISGTISAVMLYSVYPSFWNGHQVVSGSNWIQGC